MRTLISATALLLTITFGFVRPCCAKVAPGHEGHNHAEAGHDHAAHEGHEHPTTGPHGGSLLELGKEEFHAELVLDEEHDQITICLLDSTAEQPVAIEAPFIRINVKTGDKPHQYKLAPVYPEGSEAVGATDSYAIVSPELMEDLHTHGNVAKLSVKIGKKTFAAVINHEEHEHEHEGHEPAEHDHEGHEHEGQE